MPTTPDPTFMLYFPLDSRNGDSTPNKTDTSTQIYRGDLKSGVNLVSDDIFGTCMLFDGSDNSYIQLPPMNFDYSNGITVQAWVHIDRFGASAQIIDFAIGAGKDNIIFGSNDDGKLHLFVFDGKKSKNVDSDSDLPTREWIHLAATISPGGTTGSPTANLYMNGELTKSGPINLPKTVERTSNFIGKSQSSVDEYFNGKMAELKVYNRARSPLEIGLDYELRNYEPYRASHPLAFNLYNSDGHAVLFIADDPKAAKVSLTVELRNASAQSINLLKPANNTPVSPSNYHIQLNFPPGILSELSIKNYQSVQSVDDWRIWSRKEVSSGQVTLYFLHTEEKLLAASENLLLTIPLTAAVGGARSTQVEMLPNPEQVRYTDETKISGSQLTHLQILSHQGLRNIPLHVGIVGSNKVLNDGSTPNKLTLEIENHLRQDDRGDGRLTLDPGNTSFHLSFDFSDNYTEPWALSDGENCKAIKLSLLDAENFDELENDHWKITPPSSDTKAEDLEWIITAKTASLEPGDSLKIYLNTIVTYTPSGLTNLTVRYEKFPGYWDGQFVCAIEKTPLLFSGSNVGIGTTNPQIQLAIGDSETGLQQHGRGELAFYTDGQERVRVNRDGNIGIGTTTPMFPLSFQGTVGDKISLYDSQSQETIGFGVQDNLLQIHTDSSLNNIAFGYGSSANMIETMRITGDGRVGIGTTNPTEKLEVNGRIKDQTGYIAPVGTIVAYAGSTPPDGWLICNGQAIPEDDKFQELKNLIEDNVTPNLAGRTLIGAGENYYLRGSGGDETHTLTINEMPSHTHSNGAYNRLLRINDGKWTADGSDSNNSGAEPDIISTEKITLSGGNQPHNNMPPYYVVNYIIKY